MLSKVLAVGLGMIMLGSVSAQAQLFSDKSPDEERAAIREMRDDTLSKLAAAKADTKDEIAQAEGYAVFSNFGVNLLLVSTANGSGLVHDNKADKETFMHMGSVGAGVGLGAKDFRIIFVFHDREKLDAFMRDGLDLSGQADAAAKAEDQGVATSQAVSVTGVSVYQMTEQGLALQATVQGTKYWPSKELNAN